jgi:hypothetical protein
MKEGLTATVTAETTYKLVSRLPRTRPLHCTLWSDVDAESHHRQHHPGLRHWTSGLCGDYERLKGNQLCKFANDTYLIIPANKVDSRTAKVNNIEAWTRTNNLTLNRSKTKKIVFTDNRRRRQVVPQPPMADIIRATSLKILVVSTTNGQSASGNVHDVIRSCAQTLYTPSVLHAHGMNCIALQAHFRSTVVAKLQYAASTWSGFIKMTDRQCVDAFLRHSKQCGYCPLNLPTFPRATTWTKNC